MKKPGKMIELTTSAQMAGWRQRLDVFLNYLTRSQTEFKTSKHRDQEEIEKMQDLLDTKNTYMSYFKKEEIKSREELEEKTRTHVQLTNINHLSFAMTWPEETPTKSTARNANTRASGASTEKRGKSSSRDLAPHSLRRFHYFKRSQRTSVRLEREHRHLSLKK